MGLQIKRVTKTEEASMLKSRLKPCILSPGGLICCILESWQSPGTFSFANVDSPGGPDGCNLGDWPSPEINIEAELQDFSHDNYGQHVCLVN